MESVAGLRSPTTGHWTYGRTPGFVPSVCNIASRSILGPHVTLSLLSDPLQLTFVIDWKQADGGKTNPGAWSIHYIAGSRYVWLFE